MNKPIFLLLITLVGIQLPAQTVIPFGSTWKYLDNGSNQGTAWTALDYDDSNWKSGVGELGYGDGDEATVVSYGANTKKKHITTYFRRLENNADPSFFSSFLTEIKRDDGVVVYLNGIEIYRDNMPSGPISYNTLASSVNDDRNSIKSFTTNASLVAKGMNVIAVEIHQFTHGSNDLSFDMRVTGNHDITSPPLISFGSVWKYLDNGSDPGTSWTTLCYQDVNWKNGEAMLGYGNRNESTVVGFGPDPDKKYITTYFRQTFLMPKPEAYKNYSFSVKRDDGVIVYINGKEAYRNNMPGGVISYTTLARGSVDEHGLLRTFTVNASAFNAGVNLIAAEIHQSNPTSTDISFDLSLTGVTDKPEEIRITGNPNLAISENEVTIRWKTNVATDSRADLGITYGNYTISSSGKEITKEHEVRLTGLEPATKYFYRLGSTTAWYSGSVFDFFTTNIKGGARSSNSATTVQGDAKNNRVIEKETLAFPKSNDVDIIKVFPTMVTRGKMITIVSNGVEAIEATIFNSSGGLIRTLKISKTALIETNNLPAGIYAIVARSKRNVVTSRFVVVD